LGLGAFTPSDQETDRLIPQLPGPTQGNKSQESWHPLYFTTYTYSRFCKVYVKWWLYRIVAMCYNFYERN